jgi:small subunit ribosomal protein S15
MSAGEIEEVVVKLAKEGVLPSKIGIVMRDQYSVPDVKAATGKNVTKILKSHDVKTGLPEDMVKIIQKAVKLYSHMGRNKKDYKSKRALEVLESRINRLTRYYKREGTLPQDWRYERERAALLVR